MITTLAEIKQRSRERSNMEGSDFVTDTELTTYINSSLAELHDLLVATYGPDYYVSSYEFTTNNTTADYTLPADFYKLKGVDIAVGGGEYDSLRPFNFNERNRASVGALGLRYRLVDDTIRFSPKPDGNYNIKLWYIPSVTKLVEDTDTFKDINDYVEYVVVDVAIKMLLKEESDASALQGAKMALKERIEKMAPNRDAEQPESISDIYAESGDYTRRNNGGY